MATPFIDNTKPFLPLALIWAGFASLMLLFQYFHIDFVVADRLFHWEGGDWTFKHHIITESILHNGGRALSEGLGALVILGFAASLMGSPLCAWRRALGYLVAALAISTLSVAVLKQWVSMDCPWDLARYGGDMPFIGLFEERPARLPDAVCFPAGHASAGYAWLALYFFFKATLPRWRWLGLAIGLSMGLTFGFAQQLRGAHFLSHDLWTLMICWTSSALLARVLLPAPASSSRDASFFITPSPTARPLQ